VWPWGILVPLWLTTAAAAAAAGDPTGQLAVASWEGRAFAHRLVGTVAVLEGGDGSLRWEIATAPDTTLAALLHRRGRGWTVILARDGAGTRNGWGDRWRPLEPDLGRVLAAATRSVLSAGPARRRIVVADNAGRLRPRLAARGRGRGGPGEVLELVGDNAGGTSLHSTRRPGSLHLSAWRRYHATYPARESFVPLWSLDELLDFAVESGNSGD
jgi:hypothetical protein